MYSSSTMVSTLLLYLGGRGFKSQPPPFFLALFSYYFAQPQPLGPIPHLGCCSLQRDASGRCMLYFFPPVVSVNFQCIAYLQKCLYFALLITKCAGTQMKHVMYVKCLEFHVLSQYPTFIHVKIFKTVVCINSMLKWFNS